MSIQFPANPPLNDTFDYDGKTYIWDGEKWTASISNSFDDAYVNIDGDTMTGDLTVPSLNGGPLAGFRNQIINGDFRVWQRGTNVNPISTGEYGADRWLTTGTTTGSSRMQRSGNATTNTNGVSGMLDANELDNVVQLVELSRPGFNSQFPIGSQWTVSFYTDQDIDGDAVPSVRFRKLSDDAGFSGTFVNAADVSSTTWQSGAFPDKGTLKHYWFTFTISGDASTIASGTSESLGIAFPSNSSGLTKMTYCQLEPGPVATPFEHRPIGIELALCQRYYQVLGRVQGFASTNVNNTSRVFNASLVTALRSSSSSNVTISVDTMNGFNSFTTGPIIHENTTFYAGGNAATDATATLLQGVRIDAEL